MELTGVSQLHWSLTSVVAVFVVASAAFPAGFAFFFADDAVIVGVHSVEPVEVARIELIDTDQAIIVDVLFCETACLSFGAFGFAMSLDFFGREPAIAIGVGEGEVSGALCLNLGPLDLTVFIGIEGGHAFSAGLASVAMAMLSNGQAANAQCKGARNREGRDGTFLHRATPFWSLTLQPGDWRA